MSGLAVESGSSGPAEACRPRQAAKDWPPVGLVLNVHGGVTVATGRGLLRSHRPPVLARVVREGLCENRHPTSTGEFYVDLDT